MRPAKLERLMYGVQRIEYRRDIKEIITNCTDAGMADKGIAAMVAHYCQERGITLQQLEKDEPYR